MTAGHAAAEPHRDESSRPLWRWSAAAVVAATTSGQVSCREVTQSVLERIESVNGHINAITLRMDEQALAEAARLDDAFARGDRIGPLHGVPVTIKDNVDVAGQRTPNGLPALADLIAPDDSPVTGNLRRAGGVVVGRTNTPEVSMRPTTNNPLYGLTRNPWSDAISCGGSSGGAGAAVLSGMCAIGHGNDIGGSIRIPALHCGVPGLKPSQGRVPAFVPSAAAERPTVAALMSVQGPIARSVADLRLALAALAVADVRDPWHIPAPLTWPDVADQPRRFALVRSLAVRPTHPQVLAALDRAAAALVAAGYEMVDLEDAQTPGIERAARLSLRLLMTDLDHQLTPVLRSAGSAPMRAYWDQVTHVEQPYSNVDDYIDALAERTTLQRAWAQFFVRTPLLVVPQLLGGLLEVDEDVRSSEDARAVWYSLLPSIAVNLLALPSVLAPTGLDEAGLPSGVQIIAPRLREDLCLAAAEVVEAANPLIPDLLFGR